MRWLLGAVAAVLLLILIVYYVIPRVFPQGLRRVGPTVQLNVTPIPTLRFNLPTPFPTSTPVLSPATQFSTPTPTIISRTPDTGIW
jgi:hypothetical protein